MTYPDKLENFISAFSSASGGCVRDCQCGKTYFDGDQSYDWADGELEELKKNKNAIELGHTVSTIIFDGIEYVIDCKCWLKRAEQIMGFIDSQNHQIAFYLNLEKKRKLKKANNLPEVI
ncbi:MAG: hypothetical protein AABY22_26115 [Nanoarchaeota archaeon]